MDLVYDFHAYELIKRKSAYRIYCKFGINRFELTFLVQLSGYLRHINRQIVSKDEIFSAITGNTKEFRKMEGYLKGCRDKQFIGSYEYISRPGSLSLGITDLGLKVLEVFNGELRLFLERYKLHVEKKETLPISLTLSVPTTHRKVAA